MKKLLLFIPIIFLLAIPGYGQKNSDLLRQRNNAPQRDQKEILAMQYYRDQNFEKAVVLFEELYKRQNSSRYYSYYLKSLIETQDYKTAEKIARRQEIGRAHV